MSRDGARISENGLTARENEILRLRDDVGLGWEECAKEIGRTRGAAHSAYARARAKQVLVDKERGVSDTGSGRVVALVDAWEGVEGRAVNEKTIQAQVASVLDQVLFFAQNDTVSLAAAPFKEKIQAIGVLIDRWQLLRGEPTSIMRVQDIRKLDEVGALLKSEMERRGLVIEGESRVVK